VTSDLNEVGYSQTLSQNALLSVFAWKKFLMCVSPVWRNRCRLGIRVTVIGEYVLSQKGEAKE